MANRYYDDLMKMMETNRPNPQTWDWGRMNQVAQSAIENKRKKEEEKKRLKEALSTAQKLAKESALDQRDRDTLKSVMGNLNMGISSQTDNDKIQELQKKIANKQTQLQAAGGDPNKVTDDRNAFEKFLNLKPNQNAFFDVMEILQRPQQALYGVVDGLIQGDDLTRRAMEGLTGKKETSGAKLLDKYGVMDDGIGQTLTGLGIDLIADPLNLLGVGAARNLTKGAAESIGKKVADVTAKDPTGVLRKVDEVIGSGGKNFDIHGNVNPAVKNINDTVNAERNYLLRSMQDNTTKAIRQAGDVGKGTDIGKIMEKDILVGRRNQLDEEASNLTKQLDELTNKRQTANDVLTRENKIKELQKAKPYTDASSVIKNYESTNPKIRTQIDKIMQKAEDEMRGLTHVEQAKINRLRGQLVDDAAYMNAKALVATIDDRINSMRTSVDEYRETFGSPKRNLNTNTNRINKTQDQLDAVQDSSKLNYLDNKIDEVNQISQNPQLRQAAETLVQGNKAILDYAQVNNIKMDEIEGYMARVLTDEAAKILNHSDVSSPLRSNVKANDKVLDRKIKNLTVDEANDILRKEYGVDVFDPNAFFATAKGQHRLISYMTKEKMINEILSNPDLAVEATSKVMQPKNSVLRRVNDKTYYVSKGASNVLNNFEKLIADESSINKFLQAYDGIQRTFKKLALFTGSYHFTNATGSLASQYISGMGFRDLTKFNTQAANTMRLVSSAAEKLGKNLTEAEAKAVKEFDDYLKQGISGVGQYSDEFVRRDSETVAKELTHRAKPRSERMVENLKPQNWLETSRKLAENMDEVFRFGTYKWQKSKGKSSSAAAKQVIQTHFNYNDLTGAERELFRRVIPFYTFTRKAIPFVLSSMISHPDRLSNMDKVIDAGYEATGQNINITPDYAKNNMQIPITEDLSVSLGLPQSSLASMVDNPLGSIYNMLTPLLKVPGDIAKNETFTGAPISQTETVEEQKPIELLKMLGLDVNMGAYSQYALEQLIPVLGRMERGAEAASAHGDAGASGLEQAMRFIGESLGLNAVKDANQEKFLTSTLYDLSDRYDDAITQQEQATNTPAPTIAQLRSSGLVGKTQASPEVLQENMLIASLARSNGLSDAAVQQLLKIKQDVEGKDGQYAETVAQLLEQQGIDPYLISLLTSNPLRY